MKTFNDPSELFNQRIKKDPINGNFICPVCGKTAKKEETIAAHMQKQDCASLSEICANTIYEENALKFFNELCNPITLSKFRQSVVYNSTLRFILFCSNIETPPENLYSFICTKFKKEPTFLKCICQKTLDSVNVHEYRIWLQRNHTIMIDSANFYRTNKENLINDESFLKTSIMKGKLSFEFILNKSPELINNMSMGNFLLLKEFIEGVI